MEIVTRGQEAQVLHEKRKDLEAEKRKKLLERLVVELSRSNPDLYYRSTSEIAALIQDHVSSGILNADDRALLQHMTRRDIGVLLSLKG